MVDEVDLIVGAHSIAEALKNSLRGGGKIVGTSDAIKEFEKKTKLRLNNFENIQVQLVKSHQLQEQAKKLCMELDFQFKRIPGQVYLKTKTLPRLTTQDIVSELASNKKLKILALDQITDVHNGAALMRTAAFFGVNYIAISMKGRFGTGPNFTRIASGAAEHVGVVECASLPKFLKSLEKQGVKCVGMSEHAKENLVSAGPCEQSVCLFLGAEETGHSENSLAERFGCGGPRYGKSFLEIVK